MKLHLKHDSFEKGIAPGIKKASAIRPGSTQQAMNNRAGELYSKIAETNSAFQKHSGGSYLPRKTHAFK